MKEHTEEQQCIIPSLAKSDLELLHISKLTIMIAFLILNVGYDFDTTDTGVKKGI